MISLMRAETSMTSGRVNILRRKSSLVASWARSNSRSSSKKSMTRVFTTGRKFTICRQRRGKLTNKLTNWSLPWTPQSRGTDLNACLNSTTQRPTLRGGLRTRDRLMTEYLTTVSGSFSMRDSNDFTWLIPID